MGKIVVLAGDDDADAVKAALDGASLDYDIVEPTPSNLLHIVIGMVDGDEEPKKEKKEKKETKDEPPEDTPPEDEVPPPEEAPPEEPKQESLGMVSVNGELIEAFNARTDTTTLQVKSVKFGPKTTYQLNESEFSFWSQDERTQQVFVSRPASSSSMGLSALNITLKSGDSDRLLVGKDLIQLFAK